MKNKYMPVLIVSAIALIGFLFLPYVSILGYEVSLMDILTEFGGEVDGTLPVALSVFGGIVAIGGCLKKNKKGALLGSIAGAAGVVVLLLDVMDSAGSMAGNVFDVLGSAVWVGLIGFVVAAIMAAKIKE